MPSHAAAGDAATRLVMVTRSERHYTTTVSVARTEVLPFTPRDHDAVNAAASMFVAWAPMALRATASGQDRRAAPRGFHEVIERSAREALERGSAVAAVVLLVRDAVFFPGATQRWVAGMRAQLRPLDLAGMLAEGEIGLLMHDTNAHHAKAIAGAIANGGRRITGIRIDSDWRFEPGTRRRPGRWPRSGGARGCPR